MLVNSLVVAYVGYIDLSLLMSGILMYKNDNEAMSCSGLT